MCDKKWRVWIFFASCMNIIFNELWQQRCRSYNEQNKTYTPFFSHTIFIANFPAILIGTVL